MLPQAIQTRLRARTSEELGRYVRAYELGRVVQMRVEGLAQTLRLRLDGTGEPCGCFNECVLGPSDPGWDYEVESYFEADHHARHKAEPLARRRLLYEECLLILAERAPVERREVATCSA